MFRKIRAFLRGVRECRWPIPTNFGPELAPIYARGRAFGRRFAR